MKFYKILSSEKIINSKRHTNMAIEIIASDTEDLKDVYLCKMFNCFLFFFYGYHFMQNSN